MIEPKPAMTIDGEPWWNFSYSYDWDGKTYSFEICARSKEEADARLKRLPMSRYDGQMDGGPILAIPFFTGSYVRLVVWWRNLWAKP